MHKPELEFFPADDRPWVAVPGAPPGHYEKVLTQSPERMFVTRLMKVDPGCASTESALMAFPSLNSLVPVAPERLSNSVLVGPGQRHVTFTP